MLSQLALTVVDTSWDRRVARKLAAAINQPDDVRTTITELRTSIRTLADALEPDRYLLHLEAGWRIESVHVWIDSIDYVLADPPQR